MAVLVGQQSSGSTGDFANAGDAIAYPFVAVANGSATRIWCQLGTANATLLSGSLGIYSDNAGAPNVLLVQGSVASGFAGAGLFFADIAPTTINSGTTYWLAMVGGTQEQLNLIGNALTGAEGTTGDGIFHTPWPGTGGMNQAPIIWAESATGGTSPRTSGTPLASFIPGLPTFAPLPPTFVDSPAVYSALPASRFLNPLAPTFGLGLSGFQQPYFPPFGTIYNDTGTGTITLSGSATESHVHSSSSSGTITLSGTRTESQSHSSSASGTITLSGTRTESASFADSRSGTITLSGTGTAGASAVFDDARSGTITLSGAVTQSQSHSGTGTGTVTLSGTATENFVPPGGPGTVPIRTVVGAGL